MKINILRNIATDTLTVGHEICKYAYLCVFLFGHFAVSGIKTENSFLIKCYIITVLFCSSVPKNGILNNGFPIVLLKSYLDGGDIFLPTFFSQNTEHRKKFPSFCCYMPET